MAEPASYPGSPALSAEAREKVLQTFRHTLDMARTGRNEDALLGCDFILKMDVRFAPARKLLASLRGIAAGTVVDLSEFDAYGAAPPPAASAAPPAAPPAPVAPAPAVAPATPPSSAWATPAAPPAPAGLGSGLDGIGFDDLGPNPFASAPAPAPFAPPQPAPQVAAPLPDLSFGAPAPEISFPSTPPAGADPFASAPPDPFASASPFGSPGFPGAVDAFASAPPLPEPGAGAIDAAAGPSQTDAFAPPSNVAAFPAPAPAAVPQDPRIVQFLRQGDEASARGQLQEAIDLWSRVFLIDLSNEEASRRIDAARERQSETARQIDVLLSEGVQRYEAGDLQSAREAFLKVLTVSESDGTARNYLNQIDAALSASGGAPTTGAAPARDVEEPYLRDELEAPARPAFAEGLPSLEEHPLAEEERGEARRERSRPEASEEGRSGKVDLRVLLGLAALVLVGVAVAAWFLFKPKPPAPTAAEDVAASAPAPAQDPLQKARLLFQQGKVDEALALLGSVPPNDPRHEQALVLIEQFKSSAAPQPSAGPALSEAQVDEARLAGLASLSAGRYIDAVKSLDVVVKARPDDAEAAQALSRARDAVSALGSAIRSYNEQDYESSLRLLWDLRKQDPKNQDVEEYLFKSYFNDGVLALQSGNTKKAAESFKEASALRPQDPEAQRHLKFARKYAGGADDLLSRIYVRHVSPRP